MTRASRLTRFLAELRRRRVIRVAGVYLVSAWLVIQVTVSVFPVLLLPEWLTRAVVVLVILGFPVTLALAWAFDLTSDGVERTSASVEGGAAPRRRLRRAVVIGSAVLIVMAGAGAFAAGRLAREDVPRGDALVSELRDLVEANRYADAFELSRRARARGASISDSLAFAFTDVLTVVSDPEGAVVRARLHGIADAGWRELGRTPLRGLEIPRGDALLRIEAEGHAAVERMASSAWSRSTFPDRRGAEVLLDVRLLPSDRVPDGMVWVPGGRYQVASRDLQSLSATLVDFFIDRFEVSNARFAEFVDAGGYVRPEYWSDLAEDIRGGFGEVVPGLTDQTGLPGPRGWRAQSYPPGEADHPVTGVSWYEAAAYCRYRRARLPTLYEWEKAARDGVYAYAAGVVLPWGYVAPGERVADRANFNGSGTVPVDAHPFGISAFGAYNMAGNAKEWLANRAETGRAVTGGSWADPLYVFAEVGSVDPRTSAPTQGFRCARLAEPERSADARQGYGSIRVAAETPDYASVDESTFRSLLAHYRYDRAPLDAIIEETIEQPGWVRQRIRYNGPGGTRVIAYLFLPRFGRQPYQTLVYVPGSDVFFGANVASSAESLLGPLVRAGRALFVVVMRGMTEREYPPDHVFPDPASVAFRDELVRHATELRMGLDYLETRDDIDHDALAYVGLSWGAGSRLGFAAVDDRFSAVIFIGAGIDERVQPTLPEASNINFAPFIRAPKLVLNGRADEEHPWLTRGLPLWNLLSEPKELQLLEGVGHQPPVEQRIPLIRAFLDRTLGPPTP